MRFVIIVSITWLLLLASGNSLAATPPNCQSYSCNPSGVTWNDGDCGAPSADNTHFYFRTDECSGNQTCTPDGVGNYTCQAPSTPMVTPVYPGEMCDALHTCTTGKSNCTNNMCTNNLPCTSQTDCGGASTCVAGACSGTLNTTNQACMTDTNCAQGFGCDVSAVPGAIGMCVAYLSVAAGGSVQKCGGGTTQMLGSSYLCASGLCYQNSATAGTYACSGAPSTNGTLPLMCTSNANCTANKDTQSSITDTSTCTCGYTSTGMAYCDLFQGDSDYQTFLKNWKAWLSSTTASMCNNVRAKPVNPLINWCGSAATNSSSSWTGLVYSILRATQYPMVINAPSCVLQIVNPVYYTYENSGVAAFLISAVVLSIFY